jgi:hypothetical protein
MAKRKHDNSDFFYDREEEQEVNKIRKVGPQRKWKFDSRNVDKYFSEDYDGEDDYEEMYGGDRRY